MVIKKSFKSLFLVFYFFLKCFLNFFTNNNFFFFLLYKWKFLFFLNFYFFNTTALQSIFTAHSNNYLIFFNNFKNLNFFFFSIKNLNIFNLKLFFSKFLKNKNNCKVSFYSLFFLKKNTLILKNSNIVSNFFMLDFLENFLENFLKKFIFLKIQNSNYFYFFLQNDIMSLLLKLRQYNFFLNNWFDLRGFVEIFFVMLFNKDLNYLRNWLITNLEQCHFKEHKRFFQFFKIFINRYAPLFFLKYNCLGFKLNAAGKISGAGGSKKKKFNVYYGLNSLVAKNSKLLHSFARVRTLSGVLGLNFVLLYA